VNRKVIHIPLDMEQYVAVKEHASASGRTLADHVRFVLAADAGFPYRRLRGGRPPSPWVVVRGADAGRGVVGRYQTEEDAQNNARNDEQVMSRTDYEKETK